MPNFWNKTAQFFDEAFNGPRTKDLEFDLLTEEMLVIEKGVMALKQILEKFIDYSLNFKKLFHDISQSIPQIYNNTSPFHCLGKIITHSHTQMENLIDNYSTNVIRLIKKTTEWNVLFSQAKSQIAKREENRKVYDHYDEKLEKIFSNKNKKKKDKGKESTKEIDFHNRNIDKYKKATEAYVKSSDESYAIISEVLNKRYEMINPVLLEFLHEEKTFFYCVVNSIASLNDIESKFKQVKKSIPEDLMHEYDPCVYIRGGLLIKRHNIQLSNSINSNSAEYDILKKITTEEVFEKSVTQCNAVTQLMKQNNKKEEEEVVYIAKKASLKAELCKKRTFALIPDQFSKEKGIGKDKRNEIANGQENAPKRFKSNYITLSHNEGKEEMNDVFSDLF